MTYTGAIPPVAPGVPSGVAPTASERAYDEPLYDKAKAPPAQTETKKAPNPHAEFDRLTQEGIHEADVPATIAIPAAAQQGLDRAWERSAKGNHRREQGGNLVRNANHSYAFRDGKEGKDDTYLPDDEDVGKGQQLVGIAHTHGYEDGEENVTFSGDDLGNLVHERQPINLLISGKTQFVVARTAEFEAMLKDLDDPGLFALEKKMNEMWKKEYAGHEPVPVRAERATTKVCHAFHLAYYRGAGGMLTHVS